MHRSRPCWEFLIPVLLRKKFCITSKFCHIFTTCVSNPGQTLSCCAVQTKKSEKRINPYHFLPLPLPTAAGRAGFSLCAVLVVNFININFCSSEIAFLSRQTGIQRCQKSKIRKKKNLQNFPAILSLMPELFFSLCSVDAGIDPGQPRSCVDTKEKISFQIQHRNPISKAASCSLYLSSWARGCHSPKITQPALWDWVENPIKTFY